MAAPNSSMSAMRNLALLVVMSLVAGVLVAGVALPAVGGIGLLGKTGADSFQSLPSDLKTPIPPERSVLLDAKGHKIAQFYQEYRVNVPLADVAPIMRKAQIAIEDSRFYEHGSLDFKGTLRALARNSSSDDGSTQGGSTLTQQYVKLVQVEAAKSAKERQKVTNREGIAGYARKLQELRYAVTMEKRYSKDEILERYLNIVYYGSGAYGVEAASERYFSTTASKLTLTQAALIAGLVRSPYGYDPTRHPDVAKLRRNTVLDRMASTHAITQAQAEAAKKQPLGLHLRSFSSGCDEARGALGFFCLYVQNEVAHNAAFGKTRRDRLNALYSGGLTIRSTIDPKAQKAATRSMRQHVYDSSIITGSLASIQPGSGYMRAMVLSKKFTTDLKAKSTELNSNTAADQVHGGATGTQFGSNAKAFTLAAALQSGIPLGYEINAPGSMPYGTFPTCDGTTTVTDSVGNAGGESETGTFDLTQGTAKSVNTFFVLLERKVGLCKVGKMMKTLGMRTATGKAMQEVPSMTLGVDSVDPVHVASAYAAFGAKGKYCAPTPFEKVTDASGATVKGLGPKCHQAMSEGTAAGVAYAMQHVLQSGGTGACCSLSGRAAAGKTGTTNAQAAGWFTGYTQQLATSISLANAVSTTRYPLQGASLGPRTATGFGADGGPIWQQMMNDALKGKPDPGFPDPPENLMRAVHTTVPVPDVVGKSAKDATNALVAAGFGVAKNSVASAKPAGTVISSDPAGGSSVTTGSTVTIKISSGKAGGGGGGGGKGGGGHGAGPPRHSKPLCPPWVKGHHHPWCR